MSTTATNTTTPAKATKPPRADPNAFEVDAATKESTSQALARIVTDSTAAAVTVKTYCGAGEGLEVPDLVNAMKKAGDEAVAGDLGRVERMLSSQFLTLDAMFHNLAQRAYRQDNFKAIETMTKLALKAQAQARATAETLGVLKNPVPFVRQANITTGPQQVNNNTYAGASAHGCIQSGAGNSQSEPNKLLEANHGDNILDTRTATAAGRGHQAVEAVGAGNRPNKRRGQGAVKS